MNTKQIFQKEIDSRAKVIDDPKEYKLNIFDQYLENNQDIINSADKKRIVCTIGPTGSGKSTLLYYLFGKDLLVQKQGAQKRIALQKPDDETSFKIGQGIKSSTLLPQQSTQNGIYFYDFGGLEDFRGVEFSLLNAYFIKQIVEKADSVLFLFVVEQSTLNTIRGKQLFGFIEKTKRLQPGIEYAQFKNGLVVTKTVEQNNEQFDYYIQDKNIALVYLLRRNDKSQT
ncbi:hypothetical protein ABPG72_000501 [Tetrahymena utriculariae]